MNFHATIHVRHATISTSKDKSRFSNGKVSDFFLAAELGTPVEFRRELSSRRYVAVAERGQRGVINIYDLHTLKKRKVLTSLPSGRKSCRCLI